MEAAPLVTVWGLPNPAPQGLLGIPHHQVSVIPKDLFLQQLQCPRHGSGGALGKTITRLYTVK